MSSGKSDLVDLEGHITATTEAAVLFGDGQREAWLPLSQIEVEGADDDCTVTCPRWLAKEKGLI